MKIEGWRIDRFGGVTDRRIDGLSPGLTVIHGPNEAGKSSALWFLRAMLFGYRRRNQTPSYHPVDGSARSGRLLIVDGKGRHLTVERTDGAREARIRDATGAELPPATVDDLLGGVGYDAPPNWLGDPAVARWVLVFVDVWQWTPFVFIVVFARLQTLPEEIFEAAAVDGATTWGRLTQITLPLLASAIVFAGIFRAIDAFRTFDLVYGLTYGGPGRSTTTLSFYGFETGFSFTRYGFSSSIAYVMVIFAAVASTTLLKRVDIRREDAR